MRKVIPLFLVLVGFASTPAWAVFAVHDSVSYVQETIKAVQDQTFQQLNLDYLVTQIKETKQIVQTSAETLKTCTDTLDTAKEIYRTAEEVMNYIGDPMQMANYINSKYWYNRDVEMMLVVAKDAMSMADGKVVSIDDIESLLKRANYSGRETYSNQSEELAQAQKKAEAQRKSMEEYGNKALSQLDDLNREDQKFKGRDSTLTEIEYANYKVNVHQANSLSQLLAVETQAASLQAEQIYQQNSRQDAEDLAGAQEIHDRLMLNKEIRKKRAAQPSVGNAFIDTYLGR